MEQELSSSILATPRRSARKSVKPAQDYCEIIRGISRSASKNKENVAVEEETEDVEGVQTKWTPAQVGRISQKRGRKSRRNVAKKIDSELMEADVKLEKTNAKEVEKVEESSEKSNFEEVKVKTEDRKLEEVTKIETKKEENEDDTKNEAESAPAADLCNQEITTNEIKVEENDHESRDQEEKVSVIEENEDDTDIEAENAPAADLRMPEITTNEIKVEGNDHESKVQVEKVSVMAENEANCKDSAIEMSSVDKPESFGTYLKANPIDISDLGLSELTNDAEKAEEEMPSLIVCDDDDELDGKKEEKPNLNDTFDASDPTSDREKENENLNSTFDTSDCVIVQPPNEQQRRSSTPNKPEEIQKHLVLDDDLNTSLQPPPCKKVRINPEQMLDTPKQKTKASSRFPTPYKIKASIKDNEGFAAKELSGEQSDDQFSNTLPVTTTSSIKDFVLRSIRKRSLSVCIDGKQEMKRKRVYFHSPANQTTNIEDVDLQMAKNTLSCKKSNDKRNVTMRRKRSMSVDDVRTLKSAPEINVIRPTPTKQPNSQAKPIIRTKIPNFAAIHQRNNQKTENIAEYVARKAERAKVLLDSANKVKSAQKKPQPISTPTSARKPMKAAKRIVLPENEQAKAVKKPIMAVNSGKEYSEQWLRMQRLNETHAQISTPARQTTSRIAVKKTVTNVAPTAVQNPVKTNPRKQPATTTIATTQAQTKKVLNPTQKLNVTTLPAFSTVKPTFNLSTMVTTKTVEFNANSTTTTLAEKQDKFGARRQRHMDMFKGRAERKAAEPPARRQADVIRGVRSNRRFELQMQHRRNLDT